MSDLGSRLRSGLMPVSWMLGLTVAVAATVAAEPTPHFARLSVADGLSHAAVHTLWQDQVGFLWIGTADGLNRYDGQSLVPFHHDPEDANTLSSSNFGKIAETPDGVLWLGTWGGGLNRYDPRTGLFQRYRHDPDDPESLGHDRIEALVGDAAGALWIGTEHAGLDRFDPATGRFEHHRHDPDDATSLAHDEVKALHTGRDGTLWVSTNGGLCRLGKGGFNCERHDADDPTSLPSDRLRAIVEDAEGGLWVGTRGAGLARRDPATERWRRYHHDPNDPASLPGDSIASLLVDSFGRVWVGTYDNGLARFDPSRDAFTIYRFDPGVPASLSHNRVEALYEDRSQNLWIGTRGGGLNRLDLKPTRFRHFRHHPEVDQSLPHPSVHAVASDPRGDGRALWVGTDGGGLVHLTPDDEGDARYRHFRHDRDDVATLSSNRVWRVVVDRAGIVWTGTYEHGLNRLVPLPKESQVSEVPDGFRITRIRHDPDDRSSLASDRILSLVEGHDGALWVGTPHGLHRGAPRSQGRVTFERFQHDPDNVASLVQDYVMTLAWSAPPRAVLWIGTRGGLSRYDPTSGRFTNFRHRDGEPGLSHPHVQAVLPGRRQPKFLWLGTEGGGLSRLNVADDTFRHYLIADGMPSNVVSALLEDADGRIWIATSASLTRFDPVAETFRIYDTASGLGNHGFHRNAALASGGELFLGGVAGLTAFDPRSLVDNPYAPPVVLTSIRVFNEELSLAQPLLATEEIVLGPDDDFVDIEFAGLEYTTVESNRYSYRLWRPSRLDSSGPGPDDGWVEAGTRRNASYARLGPSRYVFEVKAANADGVWSVTPRRLGIVVTPPWWRQPAFSILGLVAVAILVIVVFRVQTRAIRERGEVLQAINKLLQSEVTERRRAEADRQRLIDELRAANTEMENFTHTVSHDLKSPLVTIKGFLGFVRQGVREGNAETVEKDLDQIAKAADGMADLLEDLLELSRIGRVANTPALASMDELAREAGERVAGALHERSVELVIDDGMPRVQVDRMRLVQVFQNLIDNAVKFTADVESPRIEVGVRRAADTDVFYVRDNGRGIEPRHLERIFELFAQLRKDAGGTGLGLTVVRRIVEFHGGRVWAESDGPGQGATFCFTLMSEELSETQASGTPARA